MSRAQRDQGEDALPRREAIVRATWSLLAQEGSSKLTVRRIATLAKVDPSLIYHYFDSKQGLLDVALAFPKELARLLEQQRGPLERLRLIQSNPWSNWVSSVLVTSVDWRGSQHATLLELLDALDPTSELRKLSLLGFLVDRFLLQVWSKHPDPLSPLDPELLP